MSTKRKIYSALLASLIVLTIGGSVLWLSYQAIVNPDPAYYFDRTTQKEWSARP